MDIDFLTGEPYDRTLRDHSQAILKEMPMSEQIKAKSLIHCGKRVIVPEIGEGGVFLLSNGKKATFFGNTSCGNMYACPTCTARLMQKFAKKIGAGLEFLRDEYFGAMVTLTVPHLYFMKQRETTDILYETFRRLRLASKSGGTDNPIKRIFRECGIKHWVAISEYTFGKNGWHPHFHCIFWIKRNKAKEFQNYESSLNKWWLDRAQGITYKYWQKNQLHFKTADKMKSTIENLYDRAERDAGFHIGKKNGKIQEAKSGDYLCGWGAESELTGLKLKTAKLEHYTPHQILELASMGDEYYKKVWQKFVMSVRQAPIHRRVIWSHTGISQICKKAYQVKICEEIVKKNTEEKWQAVIWFDKEEWSCLKEIPYAESNILFIATHCKEILLEFIESLGLSYHLPEQHYFSAHIENIFNCVA